MAAMHAAVARVRAAEAPEETTAPSQRRRRADVFARGALKIVEAHRMVSGQSHCPLHGRRHDGGGEKGIGAGSVDDLRHTQLVVVVDPGSIDPALLLRRAETRPP